MGVLTSWWTLSDEQAMWRVQMHDDEDAFAHLLKRWREPILRLCLRMTGDAYKAEDLAQEAFARVYARRKEYQHGARFSTFLWRVAVNLCLDELRRIKRRKELALDEEKDLGSWEDLPSAEPPPDRVAIARERAELVRSLVANLPEHYRAVVVLRHYENLKFREIAEVLEIPVGTAKSRMAEALVILHQNLSRKPGESPARSDRTFKQKDVLVV